MKVGIMQPYFLPYIGYWQLMNAVDKYVIYDDVNFIKGGWINRNKILMNGEGKMINLQMNGASPNKLINEVEVLGNPIQNKKLLKTIESCYKKAPYYSDAFSVIENIINQDESNLAKYLEFSIRQICEYLSIDTEIIVSSTINKNNDLKGQDKVIEICKVIGADEYYNAVGGQELYAYDDFADREIKLSFLKTGTVEYQQFNNEFVSNLSIIDVMMFNSRYQIKDMLETYELI
ncbi:WbqC family protein [Clostridium sp. CF011]|uniref:WbqC family protein n=1 Tax=Clostridium sp. CF011 TaxID=2843318 RepID=UPI001C0B18E5|nr:WbqC family protein [Clostridium sp. CF011]MBU3091654.1 WbqC family protein [Clostridium sp. CF011]WAG69367.1 WbqC family protein [Clostridium sp. CF011]